jgi:hypothetical protein
MNPIRTNLPNQYYTGEISSNRTAEPSTQEAPNSQSNEIPRNHEETQPLLGEAKELSSNHLEAQHARSQLTNAIVNQKLLNLPDELLLKILGQTSSDGTGVNLKLRQVNKEMKRIATASQSPFQLYLNENKQNLQASGWQRNDVLRLSQQPPDQRNFVVEHRQALLASGYDEGDVLRLSRQPPDQRSFVVEHRQALLASGYDEGDVLRLSQRPHEERTARLQQLGILM